MSEAVRVPATPARGRRILLVHDEAALVRALAFDLRQAGHQVTIQADPKMLADDVLAGGVDLVVLEPALLPLDDAIALCAAFQRRGGVW
jgi:DNA-binding response OmpR family regulator